MAVIDIEAPLHEAHRDNHTHRDVNGGWLRPAVFGAMDGLVSNLALMTGVAGGAVSQHTIVLTGLAGLAVGSFALGALLPVLPYLLGATALWPAVLLALFGLFACGAVVAKVTARTWWYSGLRQLALGGAAAGVTYALGSLFGTAVG